MAKKAAKKESSKDTAKESTKAVTAKKAAPVEKDAPEEKAAKAPKADKAAKVSKAKAAKAEAAAKAADDRWTDLKEKHGKEKASKYSMSGQFVPNQPIEHPKLGWGFVISNNNDRLEVVFQDGVKILISNFNSAQKI